MTMICLAWSVSFILWAPAILFWQYIVGERTVQPNECYIQFLSEPIITFCTAIAAFYLPVTIMTFLFWKIYQETEKRAKEFQGLKGSGAGSGTGQAQSRGGSVSTRDGAAKNSSAVVRQMSAQSCSSCELNQTAPDEDNAENRSAPGAAEGRGRFAVAFLLRFKSLLPGRRLSKSITSTEGDAEQSSTDSFNNNDGAEEDADAPDPSGIPTGTNRPRLRVRPRLTRRVYLPSLDKHLFVKLISENRFVSHANCCCFCRVLRTRFHPVTCNSTPCNEPQNIRFTYL